MMTQDVFDEDESASGEEPERWRPPARCPQCRAAQTRFLRMEYEASVYECTICGIQFEADQ